VEILNAGGYRSDGRKQYELRSMNIQLGNASSIQAVDDSCSYPNPNTPDGVAFVSHGLTEASAKVFGPREPQSRRDTIHDRANINVQVVMLPFSGGMGGRRRGRGDKYVSHFPNLYFYKPFIGVYWNWRRLSNRHLSL